MISSIKGTSSIEGTSSKSAGFKQAVRFKPGTFGTGSFLFLLSIGISIIFNVSGSNTAHAEEANLHEALQSQSRYEDSLERILKRIHRAINQHKYGEHMGQSLQLTVEGGLRYLAQRDLEGAKERLKEAIHFHEDNALAYLIYADISALEGRREVAGRNYLDFWRRAEKAADVFRETLDPVDRQILASHVGGRLLLYGMELPDQKDPRDFPLLLNMSFERPSLARIVAAYGLPIFVALGIPFFLYRRFFSIDPSPDVDRVLYQIYFVLLVSYFLWIVHAFWKLKSFFGPPEWEVLVVLVAGIFGVFALQIFGRVWEHERERRDPTIIFCPHCGKSILRLATVCPFCNRKIAEPPRKENKEKAAVKM